MNKGTIDLMKGWASQGYVCFKTNRPGKISFGGGSHFEYLNEATQRWEKECSIVHVNEVIRVDKGLALPAMLDRIKGLSSVVIYPTGPKNLPTVWIDGSDSSIARVIAEAGEEFESGPDLSTETREAPIKVGDFCSLKNELKAKYEITEVSESFVVVKNTEDGRELEHNMDDFKEEFVPVFRNEPQPMQSILKEAEGLIKGARQDQYGSPGQNFSDVAIGWNVIFERAGITARSCALAMVWLKLCRELNNPKRDNLVDGSGYFGLVELIDKELGEMGKESA